MKAQSLDDVIEILGRALEIGERENAWTPEGLDRLAKRTKRIRLSIGERREMYPALEAAGITSNRAQAKALGVDKRTVANDKAGKSPHPTSTGNGDKSPPKPKPPKEEPPDPRWVVDTVQALYNAIRRVPLKDMASWDGDARRLPMWWNDIKAYMDSLIEKGE